MTEHLPTDHGPSDPPCPDCDAILAFAFRDTSGTGAHKRGDAFNTIVDTTHYVCFACATAWKTRLSGPLTPDVVGDIAFFSCRRGDCGARLTVTRESPAPTDVELTCANGHVYGVDASDDGLRLVERAR